MSKKRIIISFVAITLCFAGLTARIGAIITGDAYTAAAAAQSSFSLYVGSERGTIYDRSLKPLVNRERRTLLAVTPTAQSLLELKAALPEEQFAEAARILESGIPAVLPSPAAVDTDDIISFSLPIRTSSSQLAEHTVGYTDAQGGVSGIEAGYDELLTEKYGGSISVSYVVNALGGAVGGQYEVEDTRTGGGIVLTLDREIQALTERAAQQIDRGAVVVMRADSGELAAICSRPDFDVTAVADSLNDEKSPLFNRATAAYNVGSAFKICVAAAALEAGIPTWFAYSCGGYYQLGDTRYYCHNRSGHYDLTMDTALEQSCNPYFISLGRTVGAAGVIDMAERMGFGSALKLAEGVVSAAGSLPARSAVTAGELANLSFGQGALTATPVQVCRMMAIAVNGGYAVNPTLIVGETSDGSTVTRMSDLPQPVRVLSAETSAALREMLSGVITDGTGKNADPQYTTAGGKTSSAQTGIYQDGEEIVHAWFVGFFPAEQPKYAVAVFSEGGEAGGGIPARVFSEIADGVTLLEDPRAAAQ